jgi:hypothetical protein
MSTRHAMLFSTALSSLIGFAECVDAKNLVVGISPYMNAATAKIDMTDLVRQLTETVDPGESAVIIDAFNLIPVCKFQVPQGAGFRNPKAKLSSNAACVRLLLDFGKVANMGVKANDVMPFAVRLPQLLRFVRENYTAGASLDVIVLGSPLYDDPKEPAYSMANGHVPSDGHIRVSPGQSPYGTDRTATKNSSLRVHLVYPDDAWRLNTEHGYRVVRFWTLAIEHAGDKLLSFIASRNEAFARVKSGTPRIEHNYVLGESEKLEMVPVRRQMAGRVPIYGRQISTTVPAANVVGAAREVEIGISWDCERCDIDLYARPTRGAETLYFGHANSREGQFFKDFRQSPESVNGLETVEFQAPVDLRKLLLAINFYEGTAPATGVRGEVRIAIGNQTYAAPFQLRAATGNEGGGLQKLLDTGLAPNTAWLVVEPLKVLGQR